MIKISGASGVNIIAEFLFDLMIENGVLAEPGVHAAVDLWSRKLLLLEPERQDRVDSCLIPISHRRIHAFA